MGDEGEGVDGHRRIDQHIAVVGQCLVGRGSEVGGGDTRFDVEAAGKAGLRTIAFLCGGTSESVLREAGAVSIYRDPADFLSYYDELVTSNVGR